MVKKESDLMWLHGGPTLNVKTDDCTECALFNSQPKHMLWAFKRTVSFGHPTEILIAMSMFFLQNKTLNIRCGFSKERLQ